ncbi:hypothetical protein H0B56_16165 [Haloechinothrix sp. YIM 98757]|uniref:Uncharacterized protein n=1 Tax=Haloechinothrix aidingensis TaxID=2752311 RepID=A0A838AD25_9PSEU|nr:hypothetical protein [Haloechinothrix aidingensis]MBA0127085.1 hypothetical protein [Haloechinothrix aidingensis]
MMLARHVSTDEDHRWSAEGREVERARQQDQANRAAITVAGHSADAVECRELLEMLGLEPESVRPDSASPAN